MSRLNIPYLMDKIRMLQDAVSSDFPYTALTQAVIIQGEILQTIDKIEEEEREVK